MGLDINGTRFLLYARARGVSFDRTAMLGRQELLVGEADLEKNIRQFGLTVPDEVLGAIFSGPPHHAEGFLEWLGADEIISFDASAYEGASVVHDLNEPVPDEYKGRFSAVLDGGTLEHIFNFPAAIKNCMEMVAEGGHFLAITPTNNHSGHGFYQFSPELFFRIFSEENGFELEHLIVFEETVDSPWYEVSDPKTVNERVILVNDYPTMLLIIARRIKSVEIFRSSPQQSDYAAAWNTGPQQTGAVSSSGLFSKLQRLPAAVVRRIKLRVDRKRGMLNRRRGHFTRIDVP
jgi:hypothetical protein